MDYNNQVENAEIHQDETENQSAGDSVSSEEVFVIPRVIFNYLMIAVAFLAVGFIIGSMSSRPAGDAQINEAELADLVRSAVAEVLNIDTSAQEPEGLDQNKVYEVTYEGDPAFGPEDALVTVVEFSDFRCSYCGRFAAETLPALMKDYGDRVRFVYRDYPQFGYLSFQAAMAAQCANDQGEFWPMHNLLFTYAQELSDTRFPELAQDLGLDMETFNACMENQTHRDEIIEDFQDGQKYGPIGTPTFFINGKPLIGAQSYLVFADAIESALAAAQASS